MYFRLNLTEPHVRYAVLARSGPLHVIFLVTIKKGCHEDKIRVSRRFKEPLSDLEIPSRIKKTIAATAR